MVTVQNVKDDEERERKFQGRLFLLDKKMKMLSNNITSLSPRK